MKKTQFIDFISTIKKTLVSFIAIAVFIALGLAFYGGSSWSITHTEQALKETYTQAQVRTLWVTTPFGLSDEQIEQLKTIDGIDQAEGSNIVYRFFENKKGEKQQAAIIQMTENLDQLINIEGQLPTSGNQVAVLRCWAEEQGVVIGDVIVLQDENAADYRQLQSIQKIAQWDGNDLSELDIATDDPGYLKDNELTVTAIVDSAVYLSTNPHAHGICSDNGLYVDAVFFVSTQAMDIDAFNGYTSILLYSEELNQLNSFSDEYKTRSQTLSDEVQKLLDQWDEELIGAFADSVEQVHMQLDYFYQQYGLISTDGEALYSTLTEMQDSLEEQKHFSAILQQDSNNSFLVADNLLEVLNSLKTNLGIPFLTIGILICYSVISRLVADGAVMIGTRKALGFTRREILQLYLGYVTAAMLLGGILGIAIGVYGVEAGFVAILDDQFTFVALPLICELKEILPVFLIVGGIILVMTFLCCNSQVNRNTVALLQKAQENKVDNYFILKTRFFKKLSMLNQTVLLNLIRDKRRVFGMISGIAGAAALMMAGLNFYYNFTTAFSRQFENYYHFDYQICYDASCETTSQEVRQLLDGYDLDYAEFYISCFIMDTPDGKTNAPNVIVPTDIDELNQIMAFENDEGESVNYEQGVWVGEYYRYAFDADVGSLLQLQTLDGQQGQLAIDCYYKHHLSTPVIIMEAQTYSDTFLKEARPNAFYINSNGIDMDELNDKLSEIDGYIYTINVYESFLDSFSSEQMVVTAFAALFILMAVLMAFMTIINLLNVYISEKKNELIILMINGYDGRFAKKYIYQDTIVLTIIGIIIGLIAGVFMGERALGAVEGNLLRMIHGVSLLCCIITILATAVLTILICHQSLRRVDRFRLSDIDSGK